MALRLCRVFSSETLSQLTRRNTVLDGVYKGQYLRKSNFSARSRFSGVVTSLDFNQFFTQDMEDIGFLGGNRDFGWKSRFWGVRKSGQIGKEPSPRTRARHM
jgi:hypothetical protein